MRNEPDDQERTETPSARRCAHCGDMMISQREQARYCSRRCKELGRARRRRRGWRVTALRGNHPVGETVLGEHNDPAGLDDEDGIHYGDAGYAPAWAEQDRRINAMLSEDQGHRHARSRKPLRRPWERFRGVEDPAAAKERSDRHRAEQRDVRARLTSSPGQPESRFNGATRGAVASRGAESRQLNRRAAMRTPAPSAAHGYVFSAHEPAAPPRPGAPRDEDYFRY